MGITIRMPKKMLKHFGRIALSSIINRWSDTHPSNPRFLASEVAQVLLSLAPETHPVGTLNAGVYHAGQPLRDTSISITHGALANYFDSASTGQPPPTLETSTGPISTSLVLIRKHWMDSVANEAVRRIGNVELLALPANNSHSVALSANDSAPASSQLAQEAQPSGSSPGYLKMYQAKLRNEGERSAAESLDAEQVARQRLAQEVIELRAQLAIKDHQVTQLREDGEQLRRDLSDERRARRETEDENLYLEERLEDTMIFAECLRSDNPLSPPELTLAFQCWRELTQDGTHNPAGAGGRGVHPLVEDWLKRSDRQLNKAETERLCAVVSWRKRGAGAIRSQ